MRINLAPIVGALAGGLLAATAGAASVDLGFFRITASGAPDIAPQLKLTVATVAANPSQIDLTFTNTLGVTSRVTQIYFDDGALLGSASLIQRGTRFISGGTTLPGASSLDPVFTPTRKFYASMGIVSDSGIAINTSGIDGPADSLTIRFTLQGAATFNDALAALTMQPTAYGTLRVGVVADGIGADSGFGGRADSFVNSPFAVPLPPAAWAGLTGLAAVVGAGYLRRRAHKL